MSFKHKQKENFDNRHRTRDAPEIPSDAEVWVNTGQNPVRGRVVTASDLPLSYVVSTPTGEVRRNRSHLTIVPPTEEAPTEEAPTEIGPVPEAITQPSTQGQPLTSNIATRTRAQTGTTL